MMNFKELYISWYSRAKSFAMKYVEHEEDADNLVQDVFLDIYEHQTQLEFHQNIVAYLFFCLRNKCLNFLRHKVMEEQFLTKLRTEQELELQLHYDALDHLDMDIFLDKENSVEEVLHLALNKLPDKCKEIFILSKLKKMKQKQIAALRNLSVNTVESQMAIAYKKLREELKSY